MEVPGRFVDARQNGAIARLVIDAEQEPHRPTAGAVDDASTGRPARLPRPHRAQEQAQRAGRSGATSRRATAVTHPAQFSGLGVLAILTDRPRPRHVLARPRRRDGRRAGRLRLRPARSTSPAAATCARSRLGSDVPEGMRTEIHRFDISDPTKTVYRATGIGARASSSTTTRSPSTTASCAWPPPRSRRGSTARPARRARARSPCSTRTATSSCASARSAGSARASGSTPCASWASRATSSPSARSTRCTRSTCRDPTAPKVVGELKIPGYSAYLHPVGESRLLGIGREGADVQASLFDVSNPAAPQRLALLSFGPGATPVETEPHAFLYWAPKRASP